MDTRKSNVIQNLLHWLFYAHTILRALDSFLQACNECLEIPSTPSPHYCPDVHHMNDGVCTTTHTYIVHPDTHGSEIINIRNESVLSAKFDWNVIINQLWYYFTFYIHTFMCFNSTHHITATLSALIYCWYYFKEHLPHFLFMNWF